ncbi:hypothetical protein D3C84_1068570 [compost metagenome]
MIAIRSSRNSGSLATPLGTMPSSMMDTSIRPCIRLAYTSLRGTVTRVISMSGRRLE